MSVPLNAEIISEALEASQTISVGVFGFTLLVWDHVITFADEVEIIWGRPKTLSCLLGRSLSANISFGTRGL
jgi:hypothetical protein